MPPHTLVHVIRSPSRRHKKRTPFPNRFLLWVFQYTSYKANRFLFWVFHSLWILKVIIFKDAEIALKSVPTVNSTISTAFKLQNLSNHSCCGLHFYHLRHNRFLPKIWAEFPRLALCFVLLQYASLSYLLHPVQGESTFL